MRSTPKIATSPGVAALGALAALGVAALGALAACNQDARGPRFRAAGAAEPRRGGVLRYSLVDTVRSLDPAIGYDEYSANVMHAVFDTLIGYAPATGPGTGLELVPQLAESWTVSPDGTTYAFLLREGLMFSDGQPLLAADQAYALERVLGMPTSPFAQFLLGVQGTQAVIDGQAEHAAGIRVLDDRRLEIQLDEPDASFPYVLAMPFATPQKRSHVEAVGDDIRRAPLGTGAFRLVRWSEGDVLELARNDRYWDRQVPYLDGLRVYEAVARDSGFLRFEAAELETVDRPSAPDFLFVAQSEAWKPYLFNLPSMNTYGEKLNCSKPPFHDKRVRQAMNYALDKRKQVVLQNGRAVPAHGLLPPGMLGYDSSLSPYLHDPAKARALLAEAGYPEGFSIEYVTLQDSTSENLASALAADLAEVGIRVEIRLMSFPAYLEASGRADMTFAYTAWLMDFPDPSNFTDVKLHSRMIAPVNSNNDAFYSNPKLDALLDAAHREQDVAVRRRMYEQVEQLLYDEVPWIWNHHRNHVEVRQPYVRGYHPHPVWLRDYRSTWLDLADDGQRVPR